MARRVIYTEERIIDTAIALVRQGGLQAVTARSLGAALGSSPKPIFTAFGSMEEITAAAIRRAKQIFADYIIEAFDGDISFQRIGLRWIHFVMEEPELYRLLFMNVNAASPVLALDDIVSNFDALLEHVLDVIQRDFDLSRANARKLYNQMIIHAHGIACLLVAGETRFTENEVKKILSEAAMGLVMYYKTKG